MKKQEIRHDPVRENIVKGVQYTKDNKEKVLSFLAGIAILIGGFSYMNRTDSIKIEEASHLSGIAQNIFINGNIDEAMVKFERVLDDYPNTPGAVQALVYLLNNAIDKAVTDADKEAVYQLLENHHISINDPVVKAAYYKLQGDLELESNPVKAKSFYKKAQSTVAEDGFKQKFGMDIAIADIALENYQDAAATLESILNSDDIDFTIKNTAEELQAYLNFKLGI
jgi:tetratricopeptide (TPR) repeat protein